MYNTDKYTSRYFNSILEKDNTLIKSSSHIKKITAEYDYYYNLPNSTKRYFIQPFNLKIKNGLASYEMEKIQTKNYAELILNSDISFDSIFSVLKEIEKFKLELPPKINTGRKQSKKLVINKTEKRIQSIKDNKEELDLFNRIVIAYNYFSKNRKTWNLVLSHGDLCLSNILFVENINMVKFIDPRGATKPKDLYLDEYYDLAKLSHSILGGYEKIIYNKTTDTKELENMFLDYLKNKDICLELLRVYEASLFLSMIPMHTNSPDNILLFKKTCDRILKEVGF
jgi:hypothetical protein